MTETAAVSPTHVGYNVLPWKFSAGTPNILGAIVSGQAIRILIDLALSPNKPIYFNTEKKLDRNDVREAMERVTRHNRALTEVAMQRMSEIEGLVMYGPRDAKRRTSLVAFNVEGREAQDLAEALNDFGVESRAGCHCAGLAHHALDLAASCRLSFYIYNTVEEVEAAVATLARIVREKISLLRRRLAEIDKQAFTQRKDRGEFIRVALVGYPNVGKSTLMNTISKSGVLAENKLFATLDTTTRKVVFENTPFLLSDTVGFIRKLPHHLVESFKSTLDEVKESDILLHVVDISHPRYEEQIEVVNATLQDMGCHDKPLITIFNKMDLYAHQTFDEWLEPEVKEQILRDLHERWENETNGNCVFVSATERQNLDQLRSTILNKVRELYRIRYPYKTEFIY